MVRARHFAIIIVADCRAGSIPAWSRFAEKYDVSSLSTLPGNCFSYVGPWARHSTLTCFIWFRCKLVPGRTEMTARAYALRGNGTRMNRSSDQGITCKKTGLQIWYQAIKLHVLTTMATTTILIIFTKVRHIVGGDLIVYKHCTYFKQITIWKDT